MSDGWSWSYWPALALAGTGLLLLAVAEWLRRADRTICDFANLTHLAYPKEN